MMRWGNSLTAPVSLANFIKTAFNSRGKAQDHGFTLIEVLVSFAILGISIGAIMMTIANGLRLTVNGETEGLALALANSVLDRVGQDMPLINGHLSGNEAGYSWNVEIAPYGTADDQSGWPIVAKTITVKVQPSNAFQNTAIQLTSLKLGALDSGQ